MLKSFVQVNNGPRQEKEMWLGGGDKSKEKNNVGDTTLPLCYAFCHHCYMYTQFTKRLGGGGFCASFKKKRGGYMNKITYALSLHFSHLFQQRIKTRPTLILKVNLLTTLL